MSEEGQNLEERSATFMTWHGSNGDVHLRTDQGLMYVSKKDEALAERARSIRRGTAIKAKGSMIFSNTLSTYVFEVKNLEHA